MWGPVGTVTVSRSSADGRGCRYPLTYRAVIPAARSAPTVTCAMSWQTPARAAQLSAAVVFTLVTPGR